MRERGQHAYTRDNPRSTRVVGRVELEAAVPYDSLVAIERARHRLQKSGILNTRGTDCVDAPWRPQLERLFDGYLRLRPEIRNRIRERVKAKRKQRASRLTETLFGFSSTERVLVALAVHGPMTRARLRGITMLTHQNTALRPLTDAGILATEMRMSEKTSGTRAHDARKRIVVGLNAAFPANRELRALLVRLPDGPNVAAIGNTPHLLSNPRPAYEPAAHFSTAPLLWTLLMMNAVSGHELDVASLHRLRPQHAPFTLYGRMHWLLKQGLVTQRRQGLIIYYALNPDHRLARH